MLRSTSILLLCISVFGSASLQAAGHIRPGSSYPNTRNEAYQTALCVGSTAALIAMGVFSVWYRGLEHSQPSDPTSLSPDLMLKRYPGDASSYTDNILFLVSLHKTAKDMGDLAKLPVSSMTAMIKNYIYDNAWAEAAAFFILLTEIAPYKAIAVLNKLSLEEKLNIFALLPSDALAAFLMSAFQDQPNSMWYAMPYSQTMAEDLETDYNAQLLALASAWNAQWPEELLRRLKIGLGVNMSRYYMTRRQCVSDYCSQCIESFGDIDWSTHWDADQWSAFHPEPSSALCPCGADLGPQENLDDCLSWQDRAPVVDIAAVNRLIENGLCKPCDANKLSTDMNACECYLQIGTRPALVSFLPGDMCCRNKEISRLEAMDAALPDDSLSPDVFFARTQSQMNSELRLDFMEAIWSRVGFMDDRVKSLQEALASVAE